MHRWLFVFIGGFAGGIAIRSFFSAGGGSALGGDFTFALFLLALSAVFFLLYVIKNNDLRSRYFLTTAVLVLAVGLGVLRIDISDLHKGDKELDARVGERIVLSGVVIDEPDVRESHAKLTITLHTICRHPVSSDCVEGENVESKALIITEHYPEFRYGDEVIIRGELQKSKNFAKEKDEPGRVFDYVSFLAKDDIYYQMFYPDIELVAHGKGNPLRAVLFSFKHTLLENAARVIPEPHVSLLGGIALGAKQALGEELLDAFRATGIIHIVVLSGYNVTIVADAVGRFLRLFFRPAIGIPFSLLGILLFALMTGGGATVVRASIMAALVLLARQTGRVYEITTALFVAGFLMLFWNPKILLHDPSFQLSFLATVGLIQLAPRIEKYFRFAPTKWKIREVLTATISTQIFVLPLLLYMMGQFSVVAVPVNLLILPLIPATMFFGFATSLAGFLHEFVSIPLGYLSFALLEWQLRVVDIFASLSFATISVPAFPAIAVGVVYALYCAALWKISRGAEEHIV